MHIRESWALVVKFGSLRKGFGEFVGENPQGHSIFLFKGQFIPFTNCGGEIGVVIAYYTCPWFVKITLVSQ